MKIKKGDTVKVIAGKDKGKTGRVLEVKADRVSIEGVGVCKRHVKPGRMKDHPEGGIVEQVGTVHLSNVMLFDAASGRASRAGFKMDGDKKVRVGRGKSAGVVFESK